MWRVALGMLSALGMALVVLYVFNLWPFEPASAQANAIVNNSASLVDFDEVLEAPAPQPRRVSFEPSGIRVLHDPISISDSTITLFEEQDVSIKVETGQISDIYVNL